MKIAIIGGHLTPALSVIEELDSSDEILYIGRKYGLEGDRATSLEYQTIVKIGIPFVELKTGRLQRSFTRHTIPSLTKIPFGFYQSVRILRKFRPDVVLGFGGYVSFPVILASKFLKTPVVIHEQTLEAGATNKVVARYADKICISFDSSAKYFPKEKTVLTGNPVRKSITKPGKRFEVDEKDPVIYITGGSLGSHFINQLVGESLGGLLQNYVVVHQTGGATEFNDFDKLNILKEGLNYKRDNYIVSKFFSPEEVGSIMKASSLIVTRAGVNSVSEIILLKKPAFLIPLPVSQKDEQLKNALYVKKLGLGEVFEQKNLNPGQFIENINQMMNKIDKYKLNAPLTPIQKSAAKKIVKVIYDLQKNSH